MRHTPRAYRGMVTAPHHLLASQAGLDILKNDGTAVEACVAVAATLAVAYPQMTGIGGDGFWLIAEPDGTVRAIDACGKAASRTDLTLYAGHSAIPWRGPLAANTVAGTVSGWEAALAGDYGTLPLDRLLQDTIDLADEGVAITHSGADVAAAKGDELRCQPGAYAAIFEPKGKPLREGDRLRQPALGETLAGEKSTTLKLEGDFDAGLVTTLTKAGHEIEPVPPLNAVMGVMPARSFAITTE